MTDFIIQSNESSALLRTLNAGEVQDLSYGIKPSYPILSKQYREIRSNNTISTPAGSEVVFNLNKSMFLRNLQIRSVLTGVSTTLNSLTVPLGLDLFDRIELRSNNKVIYTMSSAYIKARVDKSPINVQQAIYRRALPLDSTTYAVSLSTGWTAGTICTFTPVFCPFFEETMQNFDLNFYEQLQLVCRVNTTTGMQLASALTAMTSTLWCWTWLPDPKYYEYLRSKNQKPSQPLTMLTYNTYTETFPMSSLTSNTVKLNVNYPVSHMWFYLRNITSALTGSETTGAIAITSFDLSVGGTKLLESVPWLVSDYECALSGACPIVCTDATAISRRRDIDAIRVVNFGLKPHDYTVNSGACSFNQINYPSLTINHPSLTTASNWVLVVCYQYWNMLTLDSSNGSVAISLSN